MGRDFRPRLPKMPAKSPRLWGGSFLHLRGFSKRDQFIPKFDGGCIGFSLAERWLIASFPTTVLIPNLAFPPWTIPPQFLWLFVPDKIKPRGFIGAMTIRRLPHLAHPSTRQALMPARMDRLCKTVGSPCVSFRRVLQNAAKFAHMLDSGSEASAVISGPIMLAAPSGKIHSCHRAP